MKKVKYFFDTEFIESASGIELVSIGIVSEDGRTFYAETAQFDERNADGWVKENVLSKLRWWGKDGFHRMEYLTTFVAQVPYVRVDETEIYGTIDVIKEEILIFIGETKPEFWAYYADYDWVLFCRIFGRMIELPRHFPMYCMDLKQVMVHMNLDKEWKRANCPDPEGEHNALVDARWNLQLYNTIFDPTTRINAIWDRAGKTK